MNSFRKLLFPVFFLCFILPLKSQIDTFYVKAIAKKQYNQKDSSLLYLSKAIEINDHNPEYYLQRGMIYFEMKDYEKAKNDFTKAESFENGISSLWLSRIFSIEKDPDQAILYLEKHLKGDKKEQKSTIRLDESFVNINDHSKWNELWLKDWYSEYELSIENIHYLVKNDKLVYAIEEFEKIIEQYPERDDAYYLRSQIYFMLKDYSSASYDLDNAIKYNPENYLYYYDRGVVNKMQRKNKKALSDFSLAIKLKPDFIPSYLERGLISLKMQYYKESIDDISFYLKFYELNEEALYSAGLLYNYLNMYQNSLIVLNNLITINPGKTDYFVARIEAYEGLFDYMGMVKDCNSALDLDPSNGLVFYKRGLAKNNLKDNSGACSDWNNAVKFGYFEANEYIHTECK